MTNSDTDSEPSNKGKMPGPDRDPFEVRNTALGHSVAFFSGTPRQTLAGEVVSVARTFEKYLLENPGEDTDSS